MLSISNSYSFEIYSKIYILVVNLKLVTYKINFLKVVINKNGKTLIILK